jgi:CBS domain-containing protein
MKVRELMTRNFVACRPDDTGEAVTAMMAERHVGHLPVIEDGVLKGLISIEDVLRHRFERAAELRRRCGLSLSS